MNTDSQRIEEEITITESLIGKYCIIRSEKAGVFAGVIVALEGETCEMADSRRLWLWFTNNGGIALDSVAKTGVCHTESKLPSVVKSRVVSGMVEIIPCEPEAILSIQTCPVAKAENRLTP